MNNFQFYDGRYIDDENLYVKEYLKKYPESDVIVGTDSEQHGEHINYVTVICMVRPTKGAHIIYKRKKEKKTKDLFSKLWNEIEFTRYTADKLKNFLIKNGCKKKVMIHLDVNVKKTAKSNIVHDSAIGYFKGLGYSVKTKPNSWVATKAADWLC
jgi:predicted RNase H-related nuclease YkuK (DUF458 family)